MLSMTGEIKEVIFAAITLLILSIIAAIHFALLKDKVATLACLIVVFAMLCPLIFRVLLDH